MFSSKLNHGERFDHQWFILFYFIIYLCSSMHLFDYLPFCSIVNLSYLFFFNIIK